MIHFHPLANSHFALLLKWLKMPHVKVWWDQDIDWTPQRVEEKYGTYVQGYKIKDALQKPIHAYIIRLNHQEIGYIQLYNARHFLREEPVDFSGFPDSLGALDLFIGEPEYIGKGYCSQILQEFLKQCVEPSYDACFVDPDADNLRAIRAYEKAGFEKVGLSPNAKAVYMLREKKK